MWAANYIEMEWFNRKNMQYKLSSMLEYMLFQTLICWICYTKLLKKLVFQDEGYWLGNGKTLEYRTKWDLVNS